MRLRMCNPIPFEWISINGMKSKKSVDEIMHEVSRVFGVYIYEIKGKSRKHKICLARFTCMSLIHRYYRDLSLAAIGKILGGRDHSTIIYGLQTIADLLKTNWSFRNLYHLANTRISPNEKRND